MLDISKITAGMVTLLEDDADVTQLKPIVKRNSYVNMSADATPWIGVYKNGVTYDPTTLGRHSSSFKAIVDLRLIVQMGGFDAIKVEDNLEELVKKILAAIWSEPTIGGTVEMVKEFDTQYSFEETKSETQYFQWAIISIKLEARTG